MTRSTRVLAHPDQTYTVEFLVEVRVQGNGPLAIPKTAKRWAQDPGFAQIPGRVGQHDVQTNADARALVLTTCEDDALFARVVTEHVRLEDREVGGVQ